MGIEVTFTSEERKYLLRVARESVAAAVEGKEYFPDESPDPHLKRKAGAFVTLYRRGELRGCIGIIEPYLPVNEAVSQMACKASTADPRFERVSKTEMDEIEIEISVLSPPRRISNPEEVVVGRHGVIIEKGFYRGLLLPQVATENNWDRTEFLQYVCHKAGLGKEEYKDPSSKIFVFTAEVFGEARTKNEKEKGIVEGT